MKKYLLMIVAASALLACAKEMAQNELTPVSGDIEGLAEGTPISFTVEVEAASETKATISSNTNFTWEETDRAAVYASDGTTKIELTPTDISGGTATFTGSVPSGKTVAEGAIVVYPASFLTGPSTVTFPDTYADEGATKGQGTVLAAKVASGRKLNFKYLAATMKAAITDVPSVATSITVESTAVLTGAHTIDFSGTTPSLSTSSTAKAITFSSPSNGNNVLVVPVPTTGSQTFTYKVKYSSSDLFTKSTTQTMARNTYMSMADVAINPTVYLYSHMTGWEGTDAAPMTYTNGVASLKLSTIGNQYFRVKVAYPGGQAYVMGPTTDIEDGSSNGSFVDITDVESKKAVRISTSAGVYTLSFNVTDNTYSISDSGETFHLYIRGEFNSWSFTDGMKDMIHAGNKVYYYIGKMNTKMKLFYNKEYKYSQIGGSTTEATGSLVTETGSTGVINMGSDIPFILVANFSNNTFVVQNLGDDTGNGSAHTSVLLCYNDHWETSGQTLSVATDQAQTYHAVMTMSRKDTEPAQFRLYIDSSYWDAYLTNWVYVETGSGKTIYTYYNNWQIVDGTYIFAFNLKNYKYFAYDIG